MQPLAMEVDRPGNERWGVEELYHLPIDTIERDLSSHVRAFQQRDDWDPRQSGSAILATASSRGLSMLVAPFKDWNRAGILIIFAPRDQKAVLEVTKRLQLVPATKSGSVSVADFVDAIRFSLATAMELSQGYIPVRYDTILCRESEFNSARVDTRTGRLLVPGARWSFHPDGAGKILLSVQCANYKVLPLRLEHLNRSAAADGTLEPGKPYGVVEDEVVLLLPSLAPYKVTEFTVHRGGGTETVSVTCTRGDYEELTTAPMGAWVRLLEPHARTADEVQREMVSEFRSAVNRAAIEFLHMPTLLIPESPRYYARAERASTPTPLPPPQSIATAFVFRKATIPVANDMETDPSNPVQRPVAIPRLLTTERPVKIRKAPAPPSAPTKAPPTTANSKLSTLGPAKAGFKPVFGAKKPASIQKPKASVGKISATKGSKIAKPLGAAKSGAVVASKSKTTTTAAPKSTFNTTTTMAVREGDAAPLSGQQSQPQKKRKGPAVASHSQMPVVGGDGAAVAEKAGSGTPVGSSISAAEGPPALVAPKPKRPKKVHDAVTNESILALFKDKGEKGVSKLSIDPLKKWLKTAPLPGDAKVSAWGKLKKGEVMELVMKRLAELTAA